jgi:hypothetical protein
MHKIIKLKNLILTNFSKNIILCLSFLLNIGHAMQLPQLKKDLKELEQSNQNLEEKLFKNLEEINNLTQQLEKSLKEVSEGGEKLQEVKIYTAQKISDFAAGLSDPICLATIVAAFACVSCIIYRYDLYSLALSWSGFSKGQGPDPGSIGGFDIEVALIPIGRYREVSFLGDTSVAQLNYNGAIIRSLWNAWPEHLQRQAFQKYLVNKDIPLLQNFQETHAIVDALVKQHGEILEVQDLIAMLNLLKIPAKQAYLLTINGIGIS